MTKIDKALAKLYFALGEENARSQKNAENSAFMVEWLSFRALHQFPGAAANRFFAMGAASARRAATKPPRGKKLPQLQTGELSPRGGSKSVKKVSKPAKKSSEEKCIDEYIDYCDDGGFA